MKRTERDPLIYEAVAAVHDSGRKPTSRNVLVQMNPGKTLRDFAQGMNSRDVTVFRDAMRSIGYQQKPNGRWHWPEPLLPVGLDEVVCDEKFCPVYIPYHTYFDHRLR
jgi:hypothetical protein